MNKKTQQLTTAALLVAIGVALSFLSIPVGASKCFPIQHMVNVLAAVILGPAWAVLCAVVTSTLRILMGSGTLLAYPGSIFGALLAGLLYRRYGKVWAAMIGEVFGTGILGGLAAYPVAALIMGKEVAVFTFVIPFLISTVGGALIGGIVLKAMSKVLPAQYFYKMS